MYCDGIWYFLPRSSTLLSSMSWSMFTFDCVLVRLTIVQLLYNCWLSCCIQPRTVLIARWRFSLASVVRTFSLALPCLPVLFFRFNWFDSVSLVSREPWTNCGLEFCMLTIDKHPWFGAPAWWLIIRISSLLVVACQLSGIAHEFCWPSGYLMLIFSGQV